MVWEISWREFLAMGGSVMFPLLAVALMLSFFIVERFLYFADLRSKSDMTADDVITNFEKPSGEVAGTRGIYHRLCARLVHAKKIWLFRHFHGYIQDIVASKAG